MCMQIMTQAGQEVPQELHALAEQGMRGSGFSRSSGLPRGSGFSRGGSQGKGRGFKGSTDKKGLRGDGYGANKVGKQGGDRRDWQRNSGW